ncbi:MAG: trypsin-like peptidase domain-containing protein [Defluviitaleaceae bacterium]|nr:trypsin-like peptidase domain-containing protein [Defluviitaleaceae bacterium]
MKIKKYLFILLALLLSAANIISTFSQNAPPNIIVNGNRVASDGAFIENGVTYVPLRLVSEALGATVGWDGATNSVSIDLASASNDAAVARLVETMSPSVVAIVGNTPSGNLGGGSGVIIRSGGDILTNAHVVDRLQNIIVVLHDGSTYNGRVRFFDEPSDLAVVRIDKVGLPIAEFAQDYDISVGDTVIAIGTPLSFSLRNTATRGIISGMNRGISGEYAVIQTDAAINAGNSGGPLINLKGQVVGINSSGLVGIGVEGIGFAIPANTVLYVLEQFEQHGEVRRPKINAAFEESWAARRGLPTMEGLRVMNTSGGTRDEGLRQDDVILSVGGNNVHSVVDFNEQMVKYNRGDKVLFRVRRGSIEMDFLLTLS